MAVHGKPTTFADEQRAVAFESVAHTMSNITSNLADEKNIIENVAPVSISKTVAQEPQTVRTNTPQESSGSFRKTKNVLIGIHVTEEERSELRKTFCSNGFSLATAYRAAMSYLQQDIEYGKAYLTSNGEIRRR